MSQERLGKWRKRDYGWRADGVLEAADRNIPITVRRPGKNQHVSGVSYTLANGWTAGKNSMRVPAIEAVSFGHESRTLEYTNTGTSSALAENVRDAAVIDGQSKDLRRAAVGLSMGGTVLTMAFLVVKSRLEAATVVAPGKYIKPEYYSRFKVVQSFLAETQEITEVGRNPLQALYLGVTSAANCIRRPQAVRTELVELLNGTVHDELCQTKAQPEAPYVRIVNMLGDKLLPEHAQTASIAGLPFDEVIVAEGGHGRLAYDQTLSNQIFEQDMALLFPISSLSAGARGVAA